MEGNSKLTDVFAEGTPITKSRRSFSPLLPFFPFLSFFLLRGKGENKGKGGNEGRGARMVISRR